MRVLFVNPLPWENITKEGRVIIPLNVTFEPFRLPLSMCLAAAAVRHWNPGVEVEILDCQAKGMDRGALAARLAGLRPDLTVINISSPTLDSDLDAARAARAAGSRVAVFGQHAQALPEHLLKTEADIDFAMTGEPERASADLVARLREGGSGVGVPGICARDSGGEPRVTVQGEPMEVDALPWPARDLVDQDLYRLPDGPRYTSVLASRGCPFDCPFCLAPGMHGRRVRYRDPAGLVAEVRELARGEGIRSFLFQADLFTAKRSWVMEVCRRLREEVPGIRWICNSRVDTLDYDLLRTMRDAGLFLLTFGLESGDPEMLRVLGKSQTSPEDIRRTVGQCAELGIKTNGSFVIGHPGETRETLARTRDLILSLPLDMAVLMCSTPHPGTPLYDELSEGDGFLTEEFTDYTFNRYVVRGTDLTPDEIAAFIKEVRFRFYASPRYVLRRLRDLRHPVAFLRTTHFAIKRLIASRRGFRPPESIHRTQRHAGVESNFDAQRNPHGEGHHRGPVRTSRYRFATGQADRSVISS